MATPSIQSQYSFVERSCLYRNLDQVNFRQKQILQELETGTFECTAVRAAHFVIEHPEIIAGAFRPTAEEVIEISSTLIGLAPIIVSIGLAPPPGPAVACGIVGGIVGIWYGAVTVPKLAIIKNTHFYHQWKTLWNRIQKNKVLLEYILKDDQLEHFLCKLSKKLPFIAVKIQGFDHVYDFDEINQWIIDNPNKKFPHTKKILQVHDLEFDFVHTHSIVDRLENLRIKTIRALDPEAYTYSYAVNYFFDSFQSARPSGNGVRSIVIEYLGLSNRTRHPLLENLFDVVQDYNSALNEVRRTGNIFAIEQLNHRKIIWYTVYDTPVYKEFFRRPVDAGFITFRIGTKIAMNINMHTLLLPFIAAAMFKALKVIDLTQPLDECIHEYENLP